MSFTTFVSMVSTADNSKLFLNNFYKLLKLKLFVYISQLRKSIPCGSIYSGRGGGVTFCLQKGEPMRETAYWVGGEIFWATKGEAWERTNPCVWRNMIHNKTEESLEQRPLSDLGGNSRNWGWDITHVEEIWYIIKLKRVLNNDLYQTWGETAETGVGTYGGVLEERDGERNAQIF
jgi:hypothetical protein